MTRQRRRELALPLVTPRLLIREFTAADEDAVVGFYTDTRITRHMLFGPRDAEAARRHLRGILRRQQEPRRDSWELAVAPAGGGTPLGACDVARVAADTAEIGYLLSPPNWGQGYATEVAVALLHAAFARLGVERVQSTVEVHNTRSLKVLDKAGLRWEATLRQHARVRQHWWDVHLYAIGREDWQLSRR